ncbi:MAG: lamin tail domain-containing protein [Pirellulales bacterium]
MSLQPRIESLEPRQMLDASFVVSELMALNTKTIRDEDLAFSDWIEIRNDGDMTGDLGGRYLTNNLGTLTQWQFPAGQTLAPGEHLVVFASGKDRANVAEPHTNFTLDHTGGDVALVAANGTTIESQLAGYPSLISDQSYGLIRRSTDAELVGDAAASRIHVPATGVLGTTWTGGNEPFNDSAGALWSAGTGTIGYDTANGASNFDVKVWYSTVTITNLAQSDAAIAGQNVTAQSPFSDTPLVVNYIDDDGAGDAHYAGTTRFPGNVAGGQDNFVMRATTSFFIRPEQAGVWTFGFNSDDGGRLRIDGGNVIVDDTNHPPGDFLGSISLTAGLHTLEYVYWEQGGGAEAELFAASGLKSAWDGSFSLVGDPNGALPLGSLDDLIDTDIEAAMLGQNATAYVRYPFTVTSAADVQTMQLDIQFDDGYAAYLNGTLVATSNAPGSLTFNSAASANAGLQSAVVDLSSHVNLLHGGQNILAVHGLNSAANDEEFFLDVGLAARELGAAMPETIDLPTPGAANGILEPLITEFQASNKSTIDDEDGDSSDWIEVHNPGSVDVSLAGWYLTDDPLVPMKWQFPATRLEAGGYLVVFASGKDRAVFGEELHTNFALGADGDYLALVRPDGTPAWEYEPGGQPYTPQFEDVSYGLKGSAITTPDDDENIVGLVAYYDFEDGPGSSTLTDKSGHGWNGTLVNMEPASDWVAGRIGARALAFDGTNEFVSTLATAADLDITGHSKRTIAGWVRGPATTISIKNGAVFEVGSGSGEFALRSTQFSSTWNVEQGNATLNYTQASTNVWHHVAVVYNGATTIVYVNGTERIRGDNLDLDTGGVGTFNIGKRSATNFFFNGSVDDLAVWDMALAPSVIASLAATTITPLEAPTFNRNIGTTQAGFSVRNVIASPSFPGIVTGEIGGNAGGGANPLADADTLLGLPSGHTGIASDFTFNYNRVNFRDPDGGGSSGSFSGDESFPLDAEEVDENHFAVRATATLVVPTASAGEFVFGVHADEGARLRIDGADVVLDNAIDGANLSTGTVTLAAGDHTLELVHFERTGGAELELMYKSRSGGHDDAAFELLTVVKSQQLPPPPVTIFDAEKVFFTTPTPGAPNNAGVDVFVGPTSFDVPHGFYSTPQSVNIVNHTPGVQIYYTLNGTDPYTINPTTGVATPTGTLWNGAPLNISSTTVIRAAGLYPNAAPSKVATATYLFTADIATQPKGATPAGWAGCSTGNTMNYGMDAAITTNATWGPQIDAALKQIPTMSIVTDLVNLCDPGTNGIGIYNHAGNRGRAWERPISLEMIVPDGYTDPVDPTADQADGFQVNAGLRIRGGFSRSATNPKHAFRLFFRSEYGDSKLNFPLFGNEGTDSFDGFDLRTSQNYSWTSFQNSAQNTMARDELSRVLEGDLGELYTRGRYYHLYINGVYWGLFQTEERPEADYAASYIGGNDTDYDVVKNDPRTVGVTDGNTDAYMRLFDYFSQPGGLSDANLVDYYQAQGMNPDGTRNPAYERLLDVENLQDHLILTYYTSAADSAGSRFTRPSLNNWFAIFNRENPDGFKHMAHDFEHAFDTGNAAGANYNMVSPFVNNCGSFSTFNPHCQHEILMETNSVYAQKFVDRVNEVFFNDGPLSTDRVVARLDELMSQINVAMIAEAARWGSASLNPNTWVNAVNTMRNWIATSRSGSGGVGRTYEVIDQLRAVGWYPQVGAPTIVPNGGHIDDSTEITLSVPGSVVVQVNDTVIVSGDNGAVNASYLVPNDASVDATWMQPGFNASAWATGALGIGYDNETTYVPHFTTDVRSLFTGTQSSAYIRVPFTMSSTAVDELVLRMKYDDAFVAYLNGVEVARRNFAGTPAFNSLGTLHDDTAAVLFEDVDITAFKNLLVAGPNLLSIHGINTNLTSSDFLIQPALVSRVTTTVNIDGAGQIYYTTDGSDPRAANGDPGATAVSYNAIANYLTASSAGKFFVPTAEGAAAGWQNRTYDDTAWTPSVGAIGFDTGAGETIGGFEVRVVDTTAGTFANVDQATAVLNGNTAGFTIGNSQTRSQPYVNHGDAGNFATPAVLPVFATPDREQYVIRAIANVTIPVGTWSVAVGSDDGFRLTIPGISFTSKFNANGDPGNGTNTLVYSAPRGHGQTGGAFTVSGSPLTTTITLDFYEAGGGDSVELSLATGSQGAFSTGTFAILQDGLSGWSVKTTGTNVNYDPIIQTDVEASMLNQSSSLYARFPFDVSDVALMQNLTFSIAYDDGFVAYLNGVQVASRAAPASPVFDSTATAVRSDAESLVREFIDLSGSIGQLVNGQNVLAVHLLNASASNPDALLSVTLDATFGGQPFTLSDNALVKTRAFLNGEWSPLSQAQFILGATTLAVSEINYNPAEPTMAEISAGFTNENDFEFIELINTGTRNVNLAGVAFTAGITFNFNSSPVQVLSPGERVVIVNNLAAFTLRYGGTLPSGTKIAGAYSGNLSNSGETLTLVDGLGGAIQSFAFDDDWYGNTDGLGFTLNIRDTQADPMTWGQRTSWRPSSALLGTPGSADTFAGVLAPGALVANELLAATLDPANKRIELLNTSTQPIDISGWYMSDDPANVKKYKLPTLPPIAPGEFRVLNEQTLWGSSFSLANIGGTVILHAANGTTLVGFAIYRDYGAADDGVVQGRHINSNGDSDFVALVSPTFGAANSAPRVGPIVISEVHYHPQDDMGMPPVAGDEFIELVNISAAPVSLSGWQFATGVTFAFGNVTLAPGEILVLTGVSPATFAANTENAAIPGGVQVLGPFAGSLDNSGENVELFRPGPAGSLILADRVEYNDVAPWSILADGMGPSLSKIANSAYGNDPASWTAGPNDGTPGAANGSPTLGDVNGDGTINAVDIDAVHAAINAGSTNLIYDLDGNTLVNVADATFLIESILGTRRGDANLDGSVNRADVATLGRNYGYSGTPAWAKGDFNGDGKVGVADAAIAQANMGFIAPPSPAAPAAVIAAANDGATRVATRRASAAVRVVAPAATGVDQVLAGFTRERSGYAQSPGETTTTGRGLRIRAARHRTAMSPAGVNEVDLAEIASEVRRIRRS